MVEPGMWPLLTMKETKSRVSFLNIALETAGTNTCQVTHSKKDIMEGCRAFSIKKKKHLVHLSVSLSSTLSLVSWQFFY